MASLTEVSYYSRKGINLAVIFAIAFLIIRTAILTAADLRNRFFPPPPPPPNCFFGPLPVPNAQNGIATPSGLTYTIETPDLSLPPLPQTLKVYFLPSPPGPPFHSFDKMKTQAATLGFTGSPKRLTTSLYEFSDPANPLRTLELDELSHNFRITYKYESDLSLFNEKNFSSKETIAAMAQKFFAGAAALPLDVSTGSIDTILLKLDGSNLVPATSISNTDAAYVTLNRTPLDKIPIVSPDAKRGLISALVTGNSNPSKAILNASYLYNPLDRQNFATYPSVNVQASFDQLKSGQAIFASLPDPLPKSVAIRKGFVAYLYPYPSQSYRQPVVVFSDERGFVAYVRAILPTCSAK